MDKKLLKQYTDLIKEKSSLDKRLAKLRGQSNMTSDIVQNGYKRHLVITGYDIIRDKQLKDLEFKLMDREARIIIQKTEIEDYINKIKESNIRQIFEYRYLFGMSWIQIQIKMGYNHEDTARKKLEKYLKDNLD